MNPLFFQKANHKWQKFVHSDLRQSTVKKVCATIAAIFVAFVISLIIACSVCRTWGKLGSVLKTIFTAGYETQYQNTLFSNMSILIVGGLAFIFAYKAGLFNIGISGQMIAGGTAATLICHLAKITPGLNQVIILIVSMAMGALVAGIIGTLKAYLKVHEVVSSIMFNWIIYFLSILTLSSIAAIPHDASNLNTDAPADNLLLRIGAESWIPLIIISITLVAIVAIIINFTVIGRKQKATGLSNSGALAAGYNIKSNIIIAMAVSGAISGILGVMIYCGFSPNMPVTAAIKVIPQDGFNGISVGLISMCSPIASIPVSLFFSMIKTSVSELQGLGIDSHISDVVFGIVVYGAAAIALFLNLKPYWFTLEIFKGKNYSRIRYERNMTNIELLSLSSEQCEILRKYFVYYQKTANVKSTLKLSPEIRFKMWIGNLRYNRTLRQSARNVRRNTVKDLYSYKPYFKQEMAHIVKHHGVLVVDMNQTKRGGWYIKLNDQVLRSQTLIKHIEKTTNERCGADLMKQLRVVNERFKESPFTSREIRLVPRLSYLQNVRTGLIFREQLAQENKLSYFAFIQAKQQAEAVGLSEIRSKKQYEFAHRAYLKAYQHVFDIVKKHYDSMVKTYKKGTQLDIYAVRFDSEYLQQIYIKTLKQEIASIAHIIKCQLSDAQLNQIDLLLVQKRKYQKNVNNDTIRANEYHQKAKECYQLSNIYLKKSKMYSEKVVNTLKGKIIKSLRDDVESLTHIIKGPLTNSQLAKVNEVLAKKRKFEKEVKSDSAQSRECYLLSVEYLEKCKMYNKKVDSIDTKPSNFDERINSIVAKARLELKQKPREEVNKIDITNAQADIQLKKIAKKQERKELRELKAIKKAKYKEQQAKERLIRKEKLKKEKAKERALKARLAFEAAAKKAAEKKAREAERERIRIEKQKQREQELIEKQKQREQELLEKQREKEKQTKQEDLAMKQDILEATQAAKARDKREEAVEAYEEQKAAEKAKREVEKEEAREAYEEQEAEAKAERGVERKLAKKAYMEQKVAEKAKREAEREAARKAYEEQKATEKAKREAEREAARRAYEKQKAAEQAKRDAERKAYEEKKAAERRAYEKQKAAEQAKRDAERKAYEEKKAAERRAYEEKKAAEQAKREAERKAYEAKKAAERKAYEEKKAAEQAKREAERKAYEAKKAAEREAYEEKKAEERRKKEEARQKKIAKKLKLKKAEEERRAKLQAKKEEQAKKRKERELAKRAKQEAIEKRQAKLAKQKAAEEKRERERLKAEAKKQKEREKRERIANKLRLKKAKEEKIARRKAKEEQQEQARRERELAIQAKQEARRQALIEQEETAKRLKKLSKPILSRWEKKQQKRLAKLAKKRQKENRKGGN